MNTVTERENSQRARVLAQTRQDPAEDPATGDPACPAIRPEVDT